MDWVKLLSGFFDFVKAVLGLLEAKELRQEGANAQTQVQQKQVIDEVTAANSARADVEHDIATDPDSLRQDDGFERKGT